MADKTDTSKMDTFVFNDDLKEIIVETDESWIDILSWDFQVSGQFTDASSVYFTDAASVYFKGVEISVAPTEGDEKAWVANFMASLADEGFL